MRLRKMRIRIASTTNNDTPTPIPALLPASRDDEEAMSEGFGRPEVAGGSVTLEEPGGSVTDGVLTEAVVATVVPEDLIGVSVGVFAKFGNGTVGAAMVLTIFV